MDSYKQILSYGTILEDMKNFKKNRVDVLDIPGTFYFKVLFYFNNPGDADGFTSNLLGLDANLETDSETPQTHWDEQEDVGMQFGSEAAAVSKNTAYNYLMMNGEYERAEYLKQFIYLLSELSANEPWYFKSIEGLDSAVDRAYLKDFKLKDDNLLTIKCSHDSEDMRVSTLLNLYNSACFSNTWMKEVVPANLRKFDMGIYIFQAPVNGLSYRNTDGILTGVNGRSGNPTCQYFEFHNCEIDQDSFKTGWTGIDNEKGFSLEPSIAIRYDRCMVSSYNDQMTLTIGDFVEADINDTYNSTKYRETKAAQPENETSAVNNISNMSEQASAATVSTKSKTVLGNAVEQAVAKLNKTTRSLVTKAVLGNVYGFSLANLRSALNQTGTDVWSGLAATKTQLTKAVKSVASGNVVSDTLPSLVNKNKKLTPQSVISGIVRNL